jgi:hypothetical protein
LAYVSVPLRIAPDPLFNIDDPETSEAPVPP